MRDNKKPLRSPCVLNRAHRHANGLQACYLFNDNATKVWDFTRNGNTLDVTNATWVADGIQFDANGKYAALDNTNQIVHQNAGTLLFYIRSLSAFTDGTFRMIFGQLGAGYSTGDFFIEKDVDDNLYFLIRDTGNHYITAVPSDFPNWQSGFMFGVHWDKNKTVHDSVNMAFSYNGNYINPTNKVNATTWDCTLKSTLHFGNDVGVTTRFFNGIFSHASIYSRVLNETELKNIYRKQYAKFIR